jgi:hypothetical protein
MKSDRDIRSITSTVPRLLLGPFFRVMVTGPEAPDHLRTIGWPCVTGYSLLSNWTAATEATRRPTVARVNFILNDAVKFLAVTTRRASISNQVQLRRADTVPTP